MYFRCLDVQDGNVRIQDTLASFGHLHFYEHGARPCRAPKTTRSILKSLKDQHKISTEEFIESCYVSLAVNCSEFSWYRSQQQKSLNVSFLLHRLLGILFSRFNTSWTLGNNTASSCCTRSDEKEEVAGRFCWRPVQFHLRPTIRATYLHISWPCTGPSGLLATQMGGEGHLCESQRVFPGRQ